MYYSFPLEVQKKKKVSDLQMARSLKLSNALSTTADSKTAPLLELK